MNTHDHCPTCSAWTQPEYVPSAEKPGCVTIGWKCEKCGILGRGSEILSPSEGSPECTLARTMELFLEVDPAIRQVVPSVLDAAGMGEDATKLREFEPVLNIGVVVRVCTLLQSIREAQGVAILPGTWAEVVAEAAFWAEGALWAAADGDIELLSDCMKMIRKAVQDGYSLGVSH